jgi:hypothetical protein
MKDNINTIKQIREQYMSKYSTSETYLHDIINHVSSILSLLGTGGSYRIKATKKTLGADNGIIDCFGNDIVIAGDRNSDNEWRIENGEDIYLMSIPNFDIYITNKDGARDGYLYITSDIDDPILIMKININSKLKGE